MSTWCSEWSMLINPKKGQVVHIRNYQKERSKIDLNCCGHVLQYVDHYKYLEYIIQENLSAKKTVDPLTLSATHSFGCIVNVCKKLSDMGINTYETLYDA